MTYTNSLASGQKFICDDRRADGGRHVAAAMALSTAASSPSALSREGGLEARARTAFDAETPLNQTPNEGFKVARFESFRLDAESE
jgi:hypothetical protein